MTDRVRVLRVIEYVGPRERVESTLSMGQAPANGTLVLGELQIRSALIGTYPELLSEASDVDKP